MPFGFFKSLLTYTFTFTNVLSGWMLNANSFTSKDNYDYDPDGKEIRINWGSSAINNNDVDLTGDGIQGDVPECVKRHPVDANTIIVIPDAYPNLNNANVYPAKVRQNAQIIMTPNITVDAKPCNEHVNIVSKVILGIINDEARLVFFPVLSCFGGITDDQMILLLKNILNHVKIWSAQGLNIVITMSIMFLRNNLIMHMLVQEILSYPKVSFDLAAGNHDPGLNYCERTVYSLTKSHPNFRVLGRTRLNPIIPNVLASDSNYGPCVKPNGPGDLTYNNQRQWGTSFVKEIAALCAAYAHIYPSYSGSQRMELAVKQIEKIVQANFPDGSTGPTTVFRLGATCEELAPAVPSKAPTPAQPNTKSPTAQPAKITKKPTFAPTQRTLAPTRTPTLQDFGTFNFNSTGDITVFKYYAGEEFCLAVKFDKVSKNKVGQAIFNFANIAQDILQNVTVNNPPDAARFFQIKAVKNNSLLYVYRGRQPNRVLAQTHNLNGEQIKYIGFNGKNSRYQADECSDIIDSDEYEAPTINHHRRLGRA